MRLLLDVLDDQAALAEVLESFRADRAGIEANMVAVADLMRPPGDPFHERLVAAYPSPPVPLQALPRSADKPSAEPDAVTTGP